MVKPLAELASTLQIPERPAEWDAIAITGISSDSREVRSGHLFAAIPGHEHDGIDFVDEAVQRGAAAVLTERQDNLPVPSLVVPSARRALAQVSAAFYDFPTRELFTVGVTGTNGKTTTCHWVAEVLGVDTSAVLSTVTNARREASSLTTLPSPETQRHAREAVDRGAANLILEASSAGIAQERLSAIDFDVLVFTNFSPEHVQHHRGIEAYRRAKLKLFEALKPDGWAVINADDSLYSSIASATRARLLTYGRDPAASLHAASITADGWKSRVTGVGPNGVGFDVEVPMPGVYNVCNALAAFGVGWLRGIPVPTLTERLAQASGIPGRAQFFRRPDGVSAIVDFAHNPSSLEAVLRFLGSRFSHIVAVFGCPGDGEHEKRAGMGDVAGRLADVVIVTSDNPKNENPNEIAEEIRSGIRTDRATVTVRIDRREAIEAAIAAAQPGGIVLLAGKGHETVQLVQSRREAFRDADVLRDLGFAQAGKASTRS